MVFSLEEKGTIKKCTHVNDEFISNIFLEPKSNGGFRLILNLKNLNDFICTEHFKLEDWRTASKLLKQKCLMGKIDLKEAYYTFSVRKRDRKYLRFSFNDILYEFVCLAFELSTAPYMFTKLLKPVFAFLRSKGIHCVVYLDHILNLASTIEACKKAIIYT